jgi:hypothetical protein
MEGPRASPTLYHTSMLLAMFFSGGQAVHFSPDFAARGCDGVARLRQHQELVLTERLFDEVGSVTASSPPVRSHWPFRASSRSSR